MEVSTKLFNAQAIKNFGKINEQIQDKSWSNERRKKNETYSLSFDK